MGFSTKVLALSLLCMNMVPGVRHSSCLSNRETNLSNSAIKGIMPQDITTNSQNHNTNGMKSKDIKKSNEYEKLVEACEELNKLLKNGDIENFIEIPPETATKVDSAIENFLKLRLPEGDMYSAAYWIQGIIENPRNDHKKTEVEKILKKERYWNDSIDTGTCDCRAPDILYSLTPYLNGDKKSNIDARSVFGQMMLKLTTKKDLKTMALRMIFSSFFSGSRKSDMFLGRNSIEQNPIKLYTKKPAVEIYFDDEQIKKYIDEFSKVYKSICDGY